MKAFGKLLLVLVIFLSCFVLVDVVYAEENLEVVFVNELLWSGSHVSSSDEFIELKNNSDHNIDLSGWQITAIDSKKNECLMLTIPEGVIPAGGYFLISNSEKDHLYSGGESILNVDPDLVDSSLTLSNSSLQIKLYNGQWDDGRIPIDTAGSGSTPLAGSNNTKVRSSMERKNPPQDGREGTSWQDENACEDACDIYCENSSENNSCKNSCKTSFTKNLDTNITNVEEMENITYATPESSGKPKIISANITQKEASSNGSSVIEISAEVSDPDKISDIEKVEVDLIPIGGEEHYRLYYDSGGICISDNCGIFKNDYTANSISAGVRKIVFSVYDKKFLSSSMEANLEFYHFSGDIYINEVFPQPNTSSDNEFIELYNDSNENINLYGWQLDDIAGGGSPPFTIFEKGDILAKGFLTFYKKETKITLNNTGDTVRLIDPYGNENSIISYGNAIENCSYNKTDTVWKWSTIVTPGSLNIISPPNLSNPNLDSFKSLSIKEAKNESDGSQVEITGILNSLPGIFSNLYFYVEEDESGIEIYSHDGDFPQLNIGDRIKAKGEISHTSSGWRLKIKDKDAISILETNNLILPKYLPTGEDLARYEGMLIKIKGVVVETSGNIFYIDDGSGKIKVYVQKLTNINKPRLSKGVVIEITGIVSCSRNDWRILPRFQNDLLTDINPITEETDTISLVSKAHAEENIKKLPFLLNESGIYQAKAKKLSSAILAHERLIKITEIVIIICIILFMLLMEQKYVKK